MITTPNLGLKKPAASDVLYNAVSPGTDSWGWFNDNADILDNAVLVSPSLSGLKLLQNSAGVITWQTVTGTGSPVLANTPTLISPVLGAATGTSLDLGGTTLYGSRSIVVDTGGVFNIDIGSASGDNFTVDTNKLVVKGDTGYVGIGTASPSAKLEVSLSSNCWIWATNTDAIYGSSLKLGAVSTNTRKESQLHYSSNFYILDTSVPAWRLAIDSNGNVGIGITVPTAKLHLPASTTVANTASLKIDAGAVANVPVSGNIESDGTHLYWTDAGGVRRQLDN